MTVWKQKISWKKLIIWIAVIWCVAPIIWACFYVVPYADDFYRMADYKYIDSTGSPLLFPFWFAAVLYKSTQGAFFTNFLQGIPAMPEMGIIGFRLVILINVVLFFQSVWVVLQCLLKRVNALYERRDCLITLLFFFVIMFLSINTDLSESFYWMNGLCAYMTPLTVSFFSVACYLQYDITGKIRYLLLGVPLSLIASGGVLMITGFHCFCFFLLLLYDIVKKHTIKYKILYGVAALSGAIINVVDPAYYARSKMFDTRLQGVQACKISLKRDISLISSYLLAGILLVILLAEFLVLYRRLKNSSLTFRLPGVVTALGFFGILITDFPVALGYSSDIFPARCMFVLNVAIAFFLMIIVGYWAGWCAKKQLFTFTPQWFLIAGIVCFMQVIGYSLPEQFQELTPNKMLVHLARGDYRTFSDVQMSLLHQIEESEKEDIVVYEEALPDTVWVNIVPIGLREDPNHWINMGVASYYGKNTIQKIVK